MFLEVSVVEVFAKINVRHIADFQNFCSADSTALPLTSATDTTAIEMWLHSTSQWKSALLSNSQSAVARYRGVSWLMREMCVCVCVCGESVYALSPLRILLHPWCINFICKTHYLKHTFTSWLRLQLKWCPASTSGHLGFVLNVDEATRLRSQPFLWPSSHKNLHIRVVCPKCPHCVSIIAGALYVSIFMNTECDTKLLPVWLDSILKWGWIYQ